MIVCGVCSLLLLLLLLLVVGFEERIGFSERVIRQS